MPSERNITDVIFAALILILSIIGIILIAALDFAGFYNPAWGYRYSCLGCEYYTDADLAAQVIMLITLILQVIIAINDLIPDKFIERDLEKYGMILAVVTWIFAIIGIASFGAEWGDYEWWAAEGFYGGIIAGILNTILFFLKFKNK